MKELFCIFIGVHAVSCCCAMQSSVESGNLRVNAIRVWPAETCADCIVRELINEALYPDGVSFANLSREKLKAVCAQLCTYCENFSSLFQPSFPSCPHALRLYYILTCLQLKLAGVAR